MNFTVTVFIRSLKYLIDNFLLYLFDSDSIKLFHAAAYCCYHFILLSLERFFEQACIVVIGIFPVK